MSEVSVYAGKLCEYRERGGKVWSLCRIIAVYEGNVWIHNFKSGSMPTGRDSKFLFRETHLACYE